MKKTYVKPEAVNVMYAVNENISVSFSLGNASIVINEFGYINNTDIQTGADAGIANLWEVLNFIKDAAAKYDGMADADKPIWVLQYENLGTYIGNCSIN